MFMAAVRGRLPAGPIAWTKLGQHIVVAGASGEKQIVMRFSMFFVCLAAMFMTASRGGVLLSLFVMVVVFIIFFRRDLPRGISLLLATLGACAVALALLELLGGNVEGRIDAAGLVEQGRLAAYQSALRIIADYPWFGTGLGTFTSIFPAYRSANISIAGVWNVAHSTPLELAIELGIPLTVVIAAGWIVVFFVLMRGTRRSRRETVVPLAAMAASLIAILHSSIDFSLQVSGYAIVIFSAVGVGLAESFNVTPADGYRQRSRRSQVANDEMPGAENALRLKANSAPGNGDRSAGARSGFLPPT
jgi:O-antigen ligase